MALRIPRPTNPRANRRTVSPRAASRLYIGLGLVALLGCAGLALYPQLALRGTQVAEANVISLRGDDTAGWSPVVQFTEPDGGLVRWSGAARSKPAAYAVGDRIRVVYEPQNPAAIAIANIWTIYAPAVATGVFGLLFLLFGLLGLRAVRRQG